MICLTTFSSQATKAVEKRGFDPSLLDRTGRALFKIYYKSIIKAKNRYNRASASKTLSRKFGEYGFSGKKISKLPRAVVKNGKLLIPNIDLEFSFQNYVDESFSLAGQNA